MNTALIEHIESTHQCVMPSIIHLGNGQCAGWIEIIVVVFILSIILTLINSHFINKYGKYNNNKNK